MTYENSDVPSDAKPQLSAVTPATITGIIAAIGTAGLCFVMLGAGNGLEGHGDGMISIAAAHSAGAVITPSVPVR